MTPFGFEVRDREYKNMQTESTSQKKRVYVDVLSLQKANGFIRPVEFTWGDGSWYKIDRLIDVQNMDNLKTHGQGKRYKVMICNQQRYLYLEDEKWYVEVEETLQAD